MQALKEITQWRDPVPNHTYLLDGNNLVAYIRQGEVLPHYFKQPIRGFDRRGRKFLVLEQNPFLSVAVSQDPDEITVQGSRGQSYTVNKAAGTCSCPGYTFRGSCKHINEVFKV